MCAVSIGGPPSLGIRCNSLYVLPYFLLPSIQTMQLLIQVFTFLSNPFMKYSRLIAHTVFLTAMCTSCAQRMISDCMAFETISCLLSPFPYISQSSNSSLCSSLINVLVWLSVFCVFFILSVNPSIVMSVALIQTYTRKHYSLSHTPLSITSVSHQPLYYSIVL